MAEQKSAGRKQSEQFPVLPRKARENRENGENYAITTDTDFTFCMLNEEPASKWG